MKHTLSSLLALAETPEGQQQIRVMVAEALYPAFPIFKKGTELRHDYGFLNSGPVQPYDSSLDAIMPEVRKLIFSKRQSYLDHLNQVMAAPIKHCIRIADREMVFAAPIHHCIALLLTLQAYNTSPITTR